MIPHFFKESCEIMKKMVCIGDSLTYGFGAYASDAWPYIVSEKLNIQCMNQGINGDFTSGMSIRFKEDVIEQAPDFVFILGGSNDILNGWPVERSLRYVDEMIAEAMNAGINPIIGIPMCIDPEELRDEGLPEYIVQKYVQKFADYKNLLQTVCVQKSLKCIDFYTLYPKYMTMEGYKYWYTDGVHPTAEGYHTMAQIVCDEIKDLL